MPVGGQLPVGARAKSSLPLFFPPPSASFPSLRKKLEQVRKPEPGLTSLHVTTVSPIVLHALRTRPMLRGPAPPIGQSCQNSKL